jgi:hypothetical protein
MFVYILIKMFYDARVMFTASYIYVTFMFIYFGATCLTKSCVICYFANL